MTSIMRSEILASSDLISLQLKHNEALWQDIAKIIKKRKPKFAMTVARGSSDHAATYAKYLLETQLFLPTASCAPSIISIYEAPLLLEDVLVIALSQSGQSTDILEVMRYARANKGLTLSLVNEIESPLAALTEFVVPLQAQKELAVAATKSFLLTLSALIQGIAIITQNDALLASLYQLPSLLDQVFKMDQSWLFSYFNANNALILGRGFNFSIAQELALKFKETVQIHAEAFSLAEVLHGPFSLFKEPIPVLVLLQNDKSLNSNLATLHKIKSTGSSPLVLCSEENATDVSGFAHSVLLPKTHALLTPLLACAYTYLLIENLALHRGLNPDQPPLIQKVTMTR